MKHLIICLTMMVLGANVAVSQGIGAERRAMAQERIEAQRVAFITQKLELTADESAVFWPVYNEFKKKQKEMRESVKPGKPIRQLNDAEALELIEAQLDLEVAMVDLKRQYFARMGESVPPRKLVRLGLVEQQFNREVLETLRQRAGKRN